MWGETGIDFHGYPVFSGPNRGCTDLSCHRPPGGPPSRVHLAGKSLQYIICTTWRNHVDKVISNKITQK